nr:NAD-dependent epimerase/dehydratase family protein [uncultured Desulfobacter sp.]
MKILIVGGSGFIGTELTGMLLKRGHIIVILDLKKSSQFPELCIQGDIRDLEAVIEASKECDLIINLAAEHADNVEPISLYYDVNVGGIKNVIAAAKANTIKKILFTSTAAVYGLDKGEVVETMTPDPFNDYGHSKYQAEQALLKWAEEYPESDLIILRPTVVFGENNRGNVYNLFHQIYSNRFAMVGSGRNEKSVAYLKNIVAFMDYIISKGSGVGIYNYTDKPDLSMNELVEITRASLKKKGRLLRFPYAFGLMVGYFFDLLSTITHREFPVSSIRIKKFCEHTTLNGDKLFATGFRAPYSLAEAIDNTIKYEFLKG